MNVSELINEILSEWAYRVDDGMPNPKNPTHITELGFVLSEMGLSDIQQELLESLDEEDKKFKNPILNKEIPYKSKDGTEKRGIVGNLLRLPDGHPGRIAAEKMLPPEGSEDRDAINKDLGGENQPTQPQQPKDDGGDSEGDSQPKEDPIQQAAAMFDPKSDPAMGARLDKEKETLAKLSGKEPEEKASTKDEETDFNPIPAKDVNAEMPQADPETFGAGSDIPDAIEPEKLEQFNTDIKKVSQIVAKAKENNQPIPNINLCQITVPGTNLYCDDNLGIPRDQMPQFKGKAVEGSRAADMPTDESGEVDTEPVFKKMLEEKGIKTLQTEVAADKLKATQKDLVGGKVIGMMGALEKDPHHEKITAPIYVSRDGYVIDGHHRWAAIVAYNAQHPDEQISMKTTVIDMDIKDAIPMCNKFAEDMGIAVKKADANKETPTEQPKKEEVEQTNEINEENFPLIDSLIEGIIGEFILEATYPKSDDGKYWVKGKQSGSVYKVIQPDPTKHDIPNKSDVEKAKADTTKSQAKKAEPKKPVKANPLFGKDYQKQRGAGVTTKKATPVVKKAEPAKKAPTGKLSSKMEDDDLYFSKKSQSDKYTKAESIVNKLPISAKEKDTLKVITAKILKGNDLTKDEKQLAANWITIPDTAEPKIYFASEIGNFKVHYKIPITFPNDDVRQQFNEFADNNEVFDAGHPVKKKSMVASKLTQARTKVSPNVSKDKSGVIQRVSIGGTEMSRVEVPDEKELVKKFKELKIANPEQEAREAIVALNRHNAMLDYIASQGDIEIIEWCKKCDTSTSDGRKNTIDAIKTQMSNKLKTDFLRYYKVSNVKQLPPSAQKILGLINTISNPYDNPQGNAAEKLQTEIDAIAMLMNDDPDFRAGVPDMQEIFDFMVKVGEGNAGFMPSASNWKVTDIVTYKPTPSFLFKKGQSPAEAIAKNLQTFKSTVMIEGGSSVKYEKGGASAGYDKVQMTVYKKHKGFDTKAELLKLFDVYKWSFTPGETNRVRSTKDIAAKQKELNSTLDRAVQAGILTPQEKKQIIAEGEAQAKRMADKVKKKVPFAKYKKCFGNTPEEQKANYQNYQTQLGLWCKMGAIAESINNNDMDYQLFANLRTKYPKRGAPKHEVIDGVSTLNGMGWSYDPGIAATGKECKFISMNNANSSHIEPIKRK